MTAGAPTREDCAELDRVDPLRPLRELFELPPELVYLDGNSLGALPKATAARLSGVVRQEWGRDLIGSWNSADWIGLPRRVGDKIARLVGAGPGELVAADSTSVNLYKVLGAALGIAGCGAPAARRILSERSNFPTDLYIADGAARERGFELVLGEAGEVEAMIDERLAVLMLTHVDYRTGRLHDMARLTRLAHDAGALVVWDLAHSAGAVPIDLHAADADFAIGCGYKYLNGGPGAPAFVWVHPRHAERLQPLSGWMGHAAPFDFATAYRPAAGIARYLCGTPPILSLAALDCGVDTVLAADEYGGMQAVRRKSLALGALFAELIDAHCADAGLGRLTPLPDAERGSQISYVREKGAYAIVQALIARRVVGDFRAPDVLRFGFTPLYTRYVDVFDAVDRLAAVLRSGEWQQPRFARRAAVT